MNPFSQTVFIVADMTMPGMSDLEPKPLLDVIRWASPPPGLAGLS